MTADEVMALIRASAKPFYCYILRRPTGEPFYVGIGSGRRIRFHEREAKNRRRRGHKVATIRSIINSGSGIGYELVAFFSTWGEAAVMERQQIAALGRLDLGLGPLLNRTDGGEGTGGLKRGPRDPALVARIAAKLVGRKLTPEHRAAIAAGNSGRKMKRESVEKARAARVGRKRSPEMRARMSEAQKARHRSPAEIELARELGKKNGAAGAERLANYRNDPVLRARWLASLQGAKRSKKFTEENRARMKVMWADPAFKARAIAAKHAVIDTPEHRLKLSEAGKRKWADPEFRARMLAARARNRA